jgi:DNA-binding beta-propeller fold protein YncE
VCPQLTAFNPTGKFVYTANAGSGNFSAIRTSTKGTLTEAGTPAATYKALPLYFNRTCNTLSGADTHIRPAKEHRQQIKLNASVTGVIL